MRLIIDFDGGKAKPKPRKQSGDGISIGNNWQTVVLTGVMIAGIVVPQFSVFLKGAFSIRDTTQPITITTGITKFRLPVASSVPITSEYGWRTHPITGNRKFHAGIDFGAGYGQPIYAVAAGRVTLAGNKGGYGNTVVIEHSNRESTLYGHASELLVSAGQQVVQGQLIGRVGSTGFSTGPHLHFEVHINRQHTNPRPFLQQLANR